MGLYHEQLGIPKRIRLRWGTLTLDYGLMKETNPRFKTDGLLVDLNTDTAEVVEVMDDKLGFTKQVMYRLPHTLTEDLVLVVMPIVDVMEGIKTGVVRNMFYVGVDVETKKQDYYDRPL